MMAMEGGERNCGVNELICVRKVSQEALGFLAAVGVLLVLMIVLFVYLNNKLSQQRPASLPALRSTEQPGSGSVVTERSCSNTELQGSSSDSEEEMVGQYHQEGALAGRPRPPALRGGCGGWDGRPMYSPLSTVYDGYSSDASAQDASYIQRMRRTPPLDELQPPPYQDEDSSPHMSCTPSDLGKSPAGGGGDRDSPPLLLYGLGKKTPPCPGTGERERDSPPLLLYGYGDNKCPSDSCSAGGGHQEDMERYLHKAYEEDAPSDSTAVMSAEGISANGWEALFPKGYDPDPDAKYGTLDVLLDYESKEQRLAVTVTAVTDIPALKRNGNFSWQVHMILLPGRKQRARTGIQKGPCPIFSETFRFSHVEAQMIADYAIRFRLYSVRRMKREQVLGEKVFYLSKMHLQGRMSVPVILDPCCPLQVGNSQVTVSELSCSDSASSFQSGAFQSVSPEILLGLLYSATTGRLSVEVIKGSHFRHMATSKPPHTYVKLTLLNAVGQEMSKCKTSTCRGQPNPTYKQSFTFQVALFQLSDVTLILSVFNKRALQRRELIGWISLGLNSSGEEELAHWTHMKECKGQQVCRWHGLLDS